MVTRWVLYRHSRRSWSRTSPMGKSGDRPWRKSRSASWRWAAESRISFITRDASRISSRVTRPSAFARCPITANVAVKNAVRVRSVGSRTSGESRKSAASSASRRSGSTRPRSARVERSRLWPSATPTSAPRGPPSAKPTAPPRIFPSQAIVFAGVSGCGPTGGHYIGWRRCGQRVRANYCVCTTRVRRGSQGMSRHMSGRMVLRGRGRFSRRAMDSPPAGLGVPRYGRSGRPAAR